LRKRQAGAAGAFDIVEQSRGDAVDLSTGCHWLFLDQSEDGIEIALTLGSHHWGSAESRRCREGDMKLQVFEGDPGTWPVFGKASRESLPRLIRSRRYWWIKRTSDIAFSLLALPAIGILAIALLLLNPFFNPGPVFYRQARMGRHGTPFLMWKFRTMIPCSMGLVRAHHEPVEEDRITRLGRFLRKYRLDELPNVFNVLRGEMSVVGPRPDAFEHAVELIDTVPRYRDRFRVLPGITGIAQVRLGYADTTDIVRRKARYDAFYVRKARVQTDLHVLARTVGVMLTGFGAK